MNDTNQHLNLVIKKLRNKSNLITQVPKALKSMIKSAKNNSETLFMKHIIGNE